MSHTDSPSSIEIFAGAHNFSVEHQYISVSSPPNSPLAAHELHRLLSPIPGASHTRNMKKSPPDSTCLPGTRTMLLDSIVTWVKSDASQQQTRVSTGTASGWRDDYGYYHYHPPSSKHVVWLCGPVGCGKSAIAQIVAKQAEEAGCLAASFFFFRGTGDRSVIARVAATLASQMAEAIPETLPYIADAMKKPLALQNASIETQFERLVYHSVLAAFAGRKRRPVLILVDGLDECEDRLEVEEFIDHMLSMFDRHPDLPLRFFISSRIEEHIREHIEVNQVHVVNLRDHHSDKDISTLVQHTFTVAATRNRVIRSYGSQWPSEEQVRALIQQARGSFIFIKTLLNFILGVGSRRDDRRTPMERFELALKMNPGLDSLYTEILQDALPIPHSSNVILTLAALKEPLSISDMARLLGIRACDVANVLVPLQSIVHVPGDDETRVTLFHTSLRDFIKDPDRSHTLFSAASRHEHRKFLAQRCLQLRLQTHKDGQHTLSYSMHYWATHWTDAHSSATDLEAMMDLADEAAGQVASPISLRLAMLIFDAQLHTFRSGAFWPPDSLCAWLSDTFRDPAPALHVARSLADSLHATRRASCDPFLHRCTVMHVMRSFVSNGAKRTCSQYVAQRLSWNILCSVDVDDGDGDRGVADFLHTPYCPSDGNAVSGVLGTGQSVSTSRIDSTRISFRCNGERLDDIMDVVERKFPGIMESTYEHGSEDVPGFYTIYKEDGLCVLDMIHLLDILDRAQDRPGTYHVVVHIGDGNIICFSNRFSDDQLVEGFRIVRSNLYTDDIFQVFSEHWSQV